MKSTKSHHTFRSRRGAAQRRHSAAVRPRPQLVADAVIANYIHDISIRHRRQGTGTARTAGLKLGRLAEGQA